MQNKCLGIFLVVITIPLVMASIISLSTNKLSTAKYYKTLFKKSDAYTLTVKALPKTEKKSNADVMSAIYTNMTPAWLEQTITYNLDQFDSYFNGKSTAIDPSIDITPFRKDIVANLPTDFQELVPNVISFSAYADYLAQAQKTINEGGIASSSTNVANLANFKKQSESTNTYQTQFFNNLNTGRKGYHLAIIFKYVLYALTLLMLAIIALAARHWYPAIFRWIGQTLLWGGLLTLGGFFAFRQVLMSLNLIDKLKLSIETKNIITPLYFNILSDFTFSIAKISLAVTLVGLLLLIASYILAHFVPQPILPSPQKEPTPSKP